MSTQRSAAMLHLQGCTVDLRTRRLKRAGGDEQVLGTLEADLLAHMAAHAGEVLTYATLLQEVWGYRSDHPRGVVQTTVSRLRTLLGEGGSHIVNVRGTGYRFVADGVALQPIAEGPAIYEPPDAFVGRADEIGATETALERGHRLITLVGPPGTGKTRLAQRCANLWRDRFPGGALFTDLVGAETLDDVCGALGRVLDVPVAGDDPVAQLGRALAARGAALLVLDNFEHVVESAAAAVPRWVAHAPDATVVVTSRTPLRVAGECEIAVRPLAVPEPGLPVDQIGAADAVDLFVRRARAVQPSFVLDTRSAPAVGDIVREVDGLPLFIELAASHVGLLTPTEVRDRLRARAADVLADRRRDAAPHHATLRASLEGSWEALSPWSRAALAQLSVFPASFTVDAAEAVLDLGAWPDATTTMDVLATLVERSLLRRAGTVGGQARFAPYLVVREAAANRLGAQGEAARRRHAAFYARFGDDEAITSLYGPDGVRAHAALREDLENLVRAAAHALDDDAPEVAARAARAAAEVYWVSGPAAAGFRLLDRVLGAPALSASWRLRLLLQRAKGLIGAGRPVDAGDDLDRALALAQGLGDRVQEGQVLATQVRGAWAQSRPAEVLALGAQALAVLQQTSDRHGQALVHGRIGLVQHERGEWDQAERAFEQSLSLLRAVGDRRTEAAFTTNLGNLYTMTGRNMEARRMYQRALHVASDAGDRLARASALGSLAWSDEMLGQHESALEAVREVLAIARAHGDALRELISLDATARNLYLLGRWDDSQAAFQEGLLVARQAGNLHREAMLLGNMGWCALDVGDLPAARRFLNRSMEVARAGGNPRGQAWSEAALADLHLACGELDQARARAQGLLDAVGGRDPAYEALVMVTLGEVSAAQGDRTQTLEWFGLAEERLTHAANRAARCRILVRKARALLRLGDAAGARTVLEAAERVARTHQLRPESPIRRQMDALRREAGGSST